MNDSPLIEPHAHLYGCLEAIDIFRLSKDSWSEHTKSIELYLNKYNKHFSTNYKTNDIFQSDHPINKISEIYLCNKPLKFNDFQIKFDLLIALFPFKPDDLRVHEYIIKKYKELNYKYIEFKVFVPPSLNKNDLDDFLRNLCMICVHHNNPSYIPRIQLSVLRNIDLCIKTTSKIIAWLDNNPQYKKFILGIDLCMDEQVDPFFDKSPFFELLKKAKLNSYIHVGECFDQVKLIPSLLRTAFAIEKGAKRLGHGLCLGTKIDEKTELYPKEYNINEINLFEYLCNTSIKCKDISALALDIVKETKINSKIRLAKELQQKVCELAGLKNTTVEVCPTSNIILSNIQKMANHPIHKMMMNNVPIIIGSDDPGIFNTSLDQEFKLVSENVSTVQYNQILSNQLELINN